MPKLYEYVIEVSGRVNDKPYWTSFEYSSTFSSKNIENDIGLEEYIYSKAKDINLDIEELGYISKDHWLTYFSNVKHQGLVPLELLK